MGEVKTEIGYLFDLLTTETYLDEEIGCNRSLRLCVFIDDLDRCPKEAVVSVLEAVILLLVDGPISVWMAIDSRIVVQCIEAEKPGLFDKANISGHEFLDKIVQLPFTLPVLTYDAKKSYLDKIINEKELDPARVLSRCLKEGLDSKLDIEGGIRNLGLSEGKNQQKDPIFPLTRIATGLDKRGHIISQHGGCKTAIGMTESELIKVVAENPQNASDEHRENLCSVISQATSHFIQNNEPLWEDSDQQRSLETDFNGNTNIGPVNPNTNSNDLYGIGPPPSGLYLPMLNEDDRSCLEALMPFIDGNPRRMKRIINIFNVSRRIAELRLDASSPIFLTQLSAKILKMVILVEQWPYRMAWLLQLIEDVKQMSDHDLDDSRMNQFFEECFGRDKVLRDESCWEVICRVGILESYRKIVCELLMSRSSVYSLKNVKAMDSDSQLFEGLLSSASKGPSAISVHDLRPTGCKIEENGGDETCLRSYMFNMPQSIPEKVSLMMDKTLHERLQKYEQIQENELPVDSNRSLSCCVQ